MTESTPDHFEPSHASAPFLESLDRFQQSAGVGRAARKMGRFLQRLVILERHHDDSLVAVARDDDRLAVLANAIHGGVQLFPRRRVGDGLHMDRITSIRDACQSWSAQESKQT